MGPLRHKPIVLVNYVITTSETRKNRGQFGQMKSQQRLGSITVRNFKSTLSLSLSYYLTRCRKVRKRKYSIFFRVWDFCFLRNWIPSKSVKILFPRESNSYPSRRISFPHQKTRRYTLGDAVSVCKAKKACISRFRFGFGNSISRLPGRWRSVDISYVSFWFFFFSSWFFFFCWFAWNAQLEWAQNFRNLVLFLAFLAVSI